MKKSVLIYLTAVVLCVGMVVCGVFFQGSRTGEVTLTEETVAGNRQAAEGLSTGFRADAGEELHWISSYDYSAGQTTSDFQRGEMPAAKTASVYDGIRFTGWEETPFVTQIESAELGELQDQKLHRYYDKIQQEVLKTGKTAKGEIRLQDYLDYYPVSFRFQFGSRIYNMKDALTGLKVYAQQNMLEEGYGAVYADEVNLYNRLNQYFKIPVIENEYQAYKVSPVEKYNPKKALGYETEIEKPLGKGEDFYQFDPIICLQEENLADGMDWDHPDFSESLSYEEEMEKDDADGETENRKASDYGLKNRILFVVNNRTAKGKPADVSGFEQGYGIYELPIDTAAFATVKVGKRSSVTPAPEPMTEKLDMVLPLDEKAEYVEMSLSKDHRYLAVFSVKDGNLFVEVADADRWTSQEPVKLFTASDKLTYAWGEDGSLAVTNHQGTVAVLERTKDEKKPYTLVYSGTPGNDFDKVFFDAEMTEREHETSRYRCGSDVGLAISVKDGKAALVQNLLAGETDSNRRNAGLVCAVLDQTGLLYQGVLKSDISDFSGDLSSAELKAIGKTAKQLIKPVESENWVQWD